MPVKLTTIALTSAMLALAACSEPLVPIEPMPERDASPEPAGQAPSGDREQPGIDV